MTERPSSDQGNLALRHVKIHGHHVGYRMAGQGPVVLLIHGMAGSSQTWRGVLPRLSKNYTVIAPDLLGHGGSAKPPGDYSLGAHASGLRDLLATLGVPRATIVGQSLGGGVAMQLAYQHPEVAERLVLVNSGGLGRDVSRLLRLFTLPGIEYLMPLLFPQPVRERGDALLQKLHRRGFRAPPHIAEMWRAYASLSEAENRQAFVRTLRAVIDPGGQSVSAKDRLYLTSQLPTMIVWGDRDPIIPVRHAHDAHELMPGSRLEIFEDAGHFPHVEFPERFTTLLEDFLATAEPLRANFTDFHDLLVGNNA